MGNKKKIKDQIFNRMTIQYKGYILLLAFFLSSTLCVAGFQVRPGVATLVWSDNFDDGNYDGWTIHNGTFSVENNYLKANSTEGTFHRASYPSNVVYGTWSFDVFFADNLDPNELMLIHFVCEDFGSFGAISYQLGIHAKDLWLSRYYGGYDEDIDHTPFTGYGWHHIDITRDSNGQFYVFIDESVYLWGTNTVLTTTNYFLFGSKGGYGIDNITVDDAITIFPKPADLQFHTDELSVTCDQGSEKDVSFWIYNYGDLLGSCNLSVGTVPSGISVDLDSENVIDLSLSTRGYSKRIWATVEASPICSPGEYSIPIEARNSTHLLDTLTLSINVEGEEPTTTSTTTTTSDDTTTTSEAGPFSGFIPILIFFATIAMITRKRKKR